MCSKSSWLSTVSVPPFLPPVRSAVLGVLTPAATPAPLLAEFELLLLEPHAASAIASIPASAATVIVLSDLMGASSALSFRLPVSPGGPWVQSVLQSVAEQVEREHGQQQGKAREGHLPPSGVEDRRRRGDHLAPAGGRRTDADAEERQRSLQQDVQRDKQRRVDDHRSHQVRQDLAEHYAR